DLVKAIGVIALLQKLGARRRLAVAQKRDVFARAARRREDFLGRHVRDLDPALLARDAELAVIKHRRRLWRHARHLWWYRLRRVLAHPRRRRGRVGALFEDLDLGG